MDKPLNQLNAFFKLAEERMLKGSDQLLYLHLFNLFNKARWNETIRVTDKELMSAMRLYDSTGKPANVNTIRNAKSRLKLKGFIDFEPGKGTNPTVYKLIQLYPCDTPEPSPCDDPCDTPCDSLRFTSYTLASEDVKTKDKEREDAGAREEIGEGLKNGEISREGQLNLPSKEVLESWKNCSGAKLGGEQYTYLTSLENAKGTEFVVNAIKKTSEKNRYDKFATIPFSFLKMTIDEILKGGEKDDRRGNNGEIAGMADQTGQTVRDDEWYKKPNAFEDFLNK